MKIKYKVLPVLIFTLIVYFSFLVSADISGHVVLTLEEAQRRALMNNLEYNRQDDNINNAIENYNETEESNEKLNSKASKGFYEYFMKPINIEVSSQTAINKVKTEKYKKENIKRKSDYNVLKAFINIKKAQYQLEIAKINADIKLKEYETAKAKYKMDLIKSTQLKTAENAYNDASESVADALKKLQDEIQNLNRLIGRDLTDYNLQIVIDLENIDVTNVDLDKLREDYIKNREDLFSLEMEAKLAEKKYEKVKERYDEFVVRLSVRNSLEEMEEAFDDALSEYEKARKDFEDATIDLDISLKKSYEDLRSATKAIDKLKEKIQDAERNLEKVKIRYDMNLATKLDVDMAEAELKTLNINLKSSIADLNLQYKDLMLYSE